jgi:hypothetical protein
MVKPKSACHHNQQHACLPDKLAPPAANGQLAEAMPAANGSLLKPCQQPTAAC